MSNASLKEQLQSLKLAPAKSEKQPRKKPRTDKGTKAQKPAWLEQAQYGVELLKAHFPNCFKEIKEIRPLKIGIKQDLVKHLSTREDIVVGDKACMVSSLSYYVNSPAYHKQVVEGVVRIDLEGNEAGNVTADEAKYSVDCRQAKLQKKQKIQQNNSSQTEDSVAK
jgi:ProP effector